MIQRAFLGLISHELYAAASNGTLGKAVKTLSAKYPQYGKLISESSTENILAMFGLNYSFSRINEVANAFKANRAAIGVKEPFSALV